MGECGHRGLCEPFGAEAWLARAVAEGPGRGQQDQAEVLPWGLIPYGIPGPFNGTALTREGPLGYNTAVVSLALACVPDTQSGSRRRDDCWHGACHGGLGGATILGNSRAPAFPLVGGRVAPVLSGPGALPRTAASRRGPRAVAWVWRELRPGAPTPALPSRAYDRLG